MAKIRVRTELESDKKIKIIVPVKEDGWFAFKIVEIQESALNDGEVLHKSNPDLFQFFLDQVTREIKKIFEI
jgi:hypothetical protein